MSILDTVAAKRKPFWTLKFLNESASVLDLDQTNLLKSEIKLILPIRTALENHNEFYIICCHYKFQIAPIFRLRRVKRCF